MSRIWRWLLWLMPSRWIARPIIPCVSSIGPGATNMVTACGCATANRIPLLVLPGDTFACRQPDPVLQQAEFLTTTAAR